MPWISPITDRSESDVVNKTTKGFYNAEDLNRVGEDVSWLAEQLAVYGYPVQVSPKTNWVMADFPTESTMTTYLGNIRALLAAFTALPNTPELPISMDKLTWQGANHIEENLQDIQMALEWMLACMNRRSGTFCSGQGEVILPT